MTTIDEARDCVICGVPMDGKTVHVERLHRAAREGKLPAPTIDEAFETVDEAIHTMDTGVIHLLAEDALDLIRERMDELETVERAARAVATNVRTISDAFLAALSAPSKEAA